MKIRMDVLHGISEIAWKPYSDIIKVVSIHVLICSIMGNVLTNELKPIFHDLSGICYYIAAIQ